MSISAVTRSPRGYRDKSVLLAASASCLLCACALALATFPFSALRLALVPVGLLSFLALARSAPVVTLVILLFLFSSERITAPFLGTRLAAAGFREILVITTILALATGNVSSDSRLRRLGLRPLFLFWTGTVLVSAVLSPTPIRGVLALRFYLVWPLLGFAAFLIVRNSTAQARRLLVALVFLGVGFAILGILQYTTNYGGLFAISEDLLSVRRFEGQGAIGLTNGRPPFGFFLAILGTTSGWMWFSRTPWLSRRTAAACTVVCAAGVLVSLSRSSWLALLVGLLAASGASKSRVTRYRGPLICGLALAALYLGANVADRLPSEIALAANSVGSLSERFGIWSDALEYVTATPRTLLFGAGLGAIGSDTLIAAEEPIIPVVDNTYVRALFELGLFGCLTALALGARLCRYIRGSQAVTKDLLYAVVACAGVFSLTVDAVYLLPGALMTAVVFGSVLSLHSESVELRG